MNKIRPVISGRTAFVAALRNFCVLGCTAVENARRRQRPPGIFHITSALAVVRMRCAMMRTACFVQSGRGRGRKMCIRDRCCCVRVISPKSSWKTQWAVLWLSLIHISLRRCAALSILFSCAPPDMKFASCEVNFILTGRNGFVNRGRRNRWKSCGRLVNIGPSEDMLLFRSKNRRDFSRRCGFAYAARLKDSCSFSEVPQPARRCSSAQPASACRCRLRFQ